MASGDERGPSVVVVGGGVIGVATAFHLVAQRDALSAPPLRARTVTIVESTGIACAASGKAGGFLAGSWCDGRPVQSLARRSFALHAALAAELHGKERYGYRPVSSLSCDVSEALSGGPRPAKSRRTSASKWKPPWLDGAAPGSVTPLGTAHDNAQLHPAQFTRALLEAARAYGGVELVEAEVTGLLRRETSGAAGAGGDGGSDASIVGVRLADGREITADVTVLAMGPWTQRAAEWLGLPEMTCRRAHSIVLRPTATDSCSPQCVFLEADGKHPELYPRPDGTVYLCGSSDDETLPDKPAEVRVREEACDELRAVAVAASSTLATATLETQQACYLPGSPDDLPVIGRVPGVKGVIVASGHTCWGILNSAATGEAVAEMVLRPEREAVTTDISALSPARFLPKRTCK